MIETLLFPSSIEQKDVVYEDKIQSIRRVIAHFDGFNKEYYVSDHGRRAAVIAMRDGKVLLVRQYRLLINGLSYEVPGGRIDDNESPEAAAVRECVEETGVRCLNVKPLISYHPSLDVWKNYTYLFYADKLEEAAEREPGQRVWIPLPECIDMVFAQQIVDSLSILALLAYKILLSR